MLRLQRSIPWEERDEIQESKENGYWLEACADIQSRNEQTETTEQKEKNDTE